MKPLLLVADGDTELCDLFQRILTAHGYEVSTTSDGLDCMHKVIELHPDVLLLDLELGCDGDDSVLGWLREGRQVPLVPVILTATAGAPQLFEELEEPPVVECLAKPFVLAALLQSVRRALARGAPARHSLSCEHLTSEVFIG